MKKSTLPVIKQIYLLSGLIFATGLIILGWFVLPYFNRAKGESAHTKETAALSAAHADCPYRRSLDGVCVKNRSEVDMKLVAVMIDNHLYAWPQSGLAEAVVVYEAPVEGNYSRFMALYRVDTNVKKVGPVRSARPYYLDWVAEYGDPMYIHVGGSPAALNKIQRQGIFGIDEFFFGWYLWRSSDRFAPYNTYTSSKLWQGAWEQYGENRTATTTRPWLFSDREPCQTDCVTNITAFFSPPVYQTVWKYSSSTTNYIRYQMGKPQVDQDGVPITAETIIVQRVKTKVLDNVGRLSLETVGGGEAIVFRDGYMIPGTWEKTSQKSRTNWFDVDGREVNLKAGKIWIEVVGQDGGVEVE